MRRTGCPINFGLEIFGDRWTLLILRDLLLQNKRRFQELLQSDEGIATNILADRLKRLEAAGVIDQALAADGPVVVDVRSSLDHISAYATVAGLRGH